MDAEQLWLPAGDQARQHSSLEREETPAPPPPPMTEELWIVDGFMREGTTLKGVAPGRATVFE